MPGSLLIDLQILLQVLLFLLFHAVSRLMPEWDFMRWWTWGWGAMAALLVLLRISLVPGVPDFYAVELYPRLSPVVALLQVALFLLGAIVLLRGKDAGDRAARPLIVAGVALGAAVGIAGPWWFDDPSLQFAFRAVSRSLGLAAVLPVCAFAFWRTLSSGRGLILLVAPLGFLMYGLNQAIYTAAGVAELLREGLGIGTFGGFGVALIFSGYATLSDLAWTAAIGLGTVVVLVNEVGRAKRALEASEFRFREVFQSAPTGMALMDARDRVVSTNRALHRLLARGRHELEGAPFPDLVHPEDRDRVSRLMRSARLETPAAGEDPNSEEEPVRYLRRDGGVVQADTSLVVAGPGVDGRPEIIAQLHDVTEKRALERHLRQAQKMEAVGSLAAGMAHDFNNLLHTVRMNAELMLLDLPEDSPSRDGLEEIGEAVQKGRAINDQILAFAGKAALERREVDLRTFFLEVEDFLGSNLPETASLRIECDGDAAVLADPERLVHLISSLVSNAGDAIGRGRGSVTVRAETAVLADGPAAASFLPELPREGVWIRLTVSDTGHGMGPETLQRAFDPFFTTRSMGRGLGLPGALGIVAAHGGAIALESREGEGTAVTVLLPAHGDVPISASQG